MEIGGRDTIWEITAKPETALAAVVRFLRERWPNCVIENTETAEIYTTYEAVPFGQVQELFVYKDARALKEWEDETAVGNMVYVIAREGELTLVTDRTEEMDEVLNTTDQLIKSLI